MVGDAYLSLFACARRPRHVRRAGRGRRSRPGDLRRQAPARHHRAGGDRQRAPAVASAGAATTTRSPRSGADGGRSPASPPSTAGPPKCNATSWPNGCSDYRGVGDAMTNVGSIPQNTTSSEPRCATCSHPFAPRRARRPRRRVGRFVAPTLPPRSRCSPRSGPRPLRRTHCRSCLALGRGIRLPCVATAVMVDGFVRGLPTIAHPSRGVDALASPSPRSVALVPGGDLDPALGCSGRRRQPPGDRGADAWSRGRARRRPPVAGRAVGRSRRNARRHTRLRLRPPSVRTHHRVVPDGEAPARRGEGAVAAAHAASGHAWATCDLPIRHAAIAAKCLAGRAHQLATPHCHQVHGGIAFTVEHGFHQRVPRGQLLDALLGRTESLQREPRASPTHQWTRATSSSLAWLTPPQYRWTLIQNSCIFTLITIEEIP